MFKNKFFFYPPISIIISDYNRGTLHIGNIFQIVFTWVIPVLVLIMLFFSSFVVIKTSQVGIKSRFGVIISNEPLTEGVHLKLPIVDDIEMVSIKQHQENFTLGRTQTRDMQPVSVSYKVIYSIPEDKVILNRREFSGDLFEVLVRPRANESIMDALAQHVAEELIINRDAISQKVKIKLSERISGHAKIDDISIVEFDFENSEFKEAVQRKVIAKQDAQAAEIKKQQSQAEADQILIKAKADAEAIRITANAITSNPKIIELRQIEVNAMIAEKWDGKTPQTVVTNGGSTLLPLGK